MAEKEPIRLFESDFLEAFSHVRPATILIIWVPVILFFGVFSFLTIPEGNSLFILLPLLLAGLFLWTFTEYTLHRFVFHYHAKTERGKRISFLFHGVHHAEPMVKTRLVMPPAVSIPLGVIFFGLFYVVFGMIVGKLYLLFPMFTGFASGYLLYDIAHYSLHHFNLKSRYLKAIRKNHMRHHAVESHLRFGVTSNLWDVVFGTLPPIGYDKP